MNTLLYAPPREYPIGTPGSLSLVTRGFLRVPSCPWLKVTRRWNLERNFTLLNEVTGVSRHEKAGFVSQAPETHCTRKSPLPLLPSGPGGVGGKTSRGTDA